MAPVPMNAMGLRSGRKVHPPGSQNKPGSSFCKPIRARKPLSPGQTLKKALLKLTPTRKRKIKEFLKYSSSQKRFGVFGSRIWIKLLIKSFKENSGKAPAIDDVQKWMLHTDFFEKTLRKILSELAPDLPESDRPSRSESSQSVNQ